MKRFLRILFRTLGTIAILAGAFVFAAGYAAPQVELDGLYIIIVGAMAAVPAGLGYLMLLVAEDYRERTPPGSGDAVHKVGILLLLSMLWVIAAALPLAGRIVMAVLLLLWFARVHRPWSSIPIVTPMGRMRYADIFDSVLSCIVFAVGLLAFGLLSGGRGGGITLGGGGGSSGGGGASGRW